LKPPECVKNVALPSPINVAQMVNSVMDEKFPDACDEPNLQEQMREQMLMDMPEFTLKPPECVKNVALPSPINVVKMVNSAINEKFPDVQEQMREQILMEIREVTDDGNDNDVLVEVSDGANSYTEIIEINSEEYTNFKPIDKLNSSGVIQKKYLSQEDLETDGYKYIAVIKCCNGTQSTHKSCRWEFSTR
jgi:hypothetical protein